MTTIRPRANPVYHQTHAREQGVPIVVAETPVNCLLRLKGRRQVLSIPWSVVYLRAAQMKAAETAKAKRETKAANKATRRAGGR